MGCQYVQISASHSLAVCKVITKNDFYILKSLYSPLAHLEIFVKRFMTRTLDIGTDLQAECSEHLYVT